jgi:hypothetical protein
VLLSIAIAVASQGALSVLVGVFCEGLVGSVIAGIAAAVEASHFHTCPSS